MRSRTRTVLAIVFGLWLVAEPSWAADDASPIVPIEDEELDAWLELLTAPRYPGQEPHTKLIDYIEYQLKQIKPVDGSSIKVERQERPFTRWDSYEPEIESENKNKKLKSSPWEIWPLPYSGFTGVDGVTAPLHYEGRVCPFFHFKRDKHAGKIVVIKIKPLQMRPVLSLISTRTLPFWAYSHPGSYRRAIDLEVQVPSLGEARRAGVRGLIVIIDDAPEFAVNQYVPFTRAYEDLPAVFVDRNLGARLAALAKCSDEKLTLRHRGNLKPHATTAHLLATLPASNTPECTNDGQAIAIVTHTDGPNLFEDNGVIALWALLRDFAQANRRCRDLVFVFAAAHFAHEPGSTDDVVRRNPELFARTRAALVIEHLGALRSSADGRQAGETEPTLLMRTPHDKGLKRAMDRVLEEHTRADKTLEPIFFINPRLFKFGEGKFLAEKKIPTIGFMPNPSYLLSEESDHAKWFSPRLMTKQIDLFRNLIEELMLLEPLSPVTERPR